MKNGRQSSEVYAWKNTKDRTGALTTTPPAPTQA